MGLGLRIHGHGDLAMVQAASVVGRLPAQFNNNNMNDYEHVRLSDKIPETDTAFHCIVMLCDEQRCAIMEAGIKERLNFLSVWTSPYYSTICASIAGMTIISVGINFTGKP